MSPKLTLFAVLIQNLTVLFLVSLAAGLPISQTSQNTAVQIQESVVLDNSTQALVKRREETLGNGVDNPPFDAFEYRRNGHRTDGETEGDILRLTKCFCIDTPSRDLPPVYGQFYGSYYGLDYYNFHLNKSYAFNWSCASGDLESLQAEFFTSVESYYLAPKCLSWMEEERKACKYTDDGNQFCAESMRGRDYYYWNGQKRLVHNHPPKAGTTYVPATVLNQECQRMCQTIPANTPGYMLDAIPSDHENKINLATATVCDPKALDGPPAPGMCDWPGDEPKANPNPRKWEAWNAIETYTDQADMCDRCAL